MSNKGSPSPKPTDQNLLRWFVIICDWSDAGFPAAASQSFLGHIAIVDVAQVDVQNLFSEWSCRQTEFEQKRKILHYF
jgi:hypothetical protein